VSELWDKVTTENLTEIGDLEGYRNEFFHLFGFNYTKVDYMKEAEEVVEIPSLQ